jgi:hypothetical protein
MLLRIEEEQGRLTDPASTVRVLFLPTSDEVIQALMHEAGRRFPDRAWLRKPKVRFVCCQSVPDDPEWHLVFHARDLEAAGAQIRTWIASQVAAFPVLQSARVVVGNGQ